MYASKHLAPVSTSIVTTPLQGRKSAKPHQYTIVENYAGGSKYIVFNNSLHNLERAINERLFLRKVNGIWSPPDQPCMLHIEMLHNVLKRDLFPHLPQSKPITFIEFIDKYVGKKRVRYEQAHAAYKRHPRMTKRDCKIAAFGKKELLPIKPSKPFDHMIQRVVQARTPKFNLAYGVYIRPIEDRVYRTIDQMFCKSNKANPKERTILKGLNAIEQATQIVNKWRRIPNVVFLGLDASRFDQSCNTELLKVLHKVIEKCFPNKAHKADVRWMNKLTLVNSCKGKAKDGEITYEIEGGLCSGEMTTAMTGCVIMSTIIYCFCTYHLKLPDFAVIDMGDDAGLFVDQIYLEKIQREIPKYFGSFGLIMTVEEPVYKIEHIEFCQTRPVYDGIKYRMVRNPVASTTKDATSLTPINAKIELSNYLNSIGKGGLSLTGGIPMIQNYYRSMIKEAHNLKGNRKGKQIKLEGGMYYLSKRMNEHYIEDICDEARKSYYDAFGILPEMQQEMENYYDNIVIQWCTPQCRTHSKRGCFTKCN